MQKYILMGTQGSGKGTQAKMLCKDFDLVHISVGDIFRWHIHSHTKLAARIHRIMARGDLVPDEIVEEIVKNRLELHDWNYGFILDGFPRNHVQAEFFLENYDIDAVIHIDVPDEVVKGRILSRRLCESCGMDFNLIDHRPVVDNECDFCKGRLIPREDDTPQAIQSRLADYHSKTEPVLGLFSKRELVFNIDGTRQPEEVQQTIRECLNLFLPEEQPAS